MTTFLHTLFLLICAHALAVYPLQGAYLAEGKNRHTSLGAANWPYCLSGHALIHGGFVCFVTGSTALGMAEAVAHAVTDFLKCERRIGMRADQAIHVGCKVVWAAIAVLTYRSLPAPHGS